MPASAKDTHVWICRLEMGLVLIAFAPSVKPPYEPSYAHVGTCFGIEPLSDLAALPLAMSTIARRVVITANFMSRTLHHRRSWNTERLDRVLGANWFHVPLLSK